MCPEPEGSQVLPPRAPSAPAASRPPSPSASAPLLPHPLPTVCPQRGRISASLYSTPVTPPSSRTAHELLGRSEAFPSGIFTPNPGPHWPPTSGTAEPAQPRLSPAGPVALLSKEASPLPPGARPPHRGFRTPPKLLCPSVTWRGDPQGPSPVVPLLPAQGLPLRLNESLVNHVNLRSHLRNQELS